MQLVLDLRHIRKKNAQETVYFWLQQKNLKEDLDQKEKNLDMETLMVIIIIIIIIIASRPFG